MWPFCCTSTRGIRDGQRPRDHPKPRGVHLVGRRPAARRLQAVRVRPGDPAAGRCCAASTACWSRPRPRCSTPRPSWRARSRTSTRCCARRPAASSSTTPRRSTMRRLLDDPAEHRRQPARLHRRVLASAPRRPREVRLRHPDRPARPGRPALPGGRRSSARSTCTPTAVSNLEMGYLYEELIRRFSELSNETAGEHFTPREVIRLMVNLLFVEDDDAAHQARRREDALCSTPPAAPAACSRSPRTTCASLNPHGPPGGLRPGAQRRDLRHLPLRHDAQGPGRLPHRARQLVLRGRPRRAQRFDYLLANPPFGVEWKKVEKAVKDEARDQGLRRPVRRRAAAHQRRLASCSCST